MSLARFALADLRAAWRQWVGAFVVLVTTAAALTCAVAIVVTADTLPARGPFPMNSSLGSLAGMNAGIVAVVGVVMVRNVVDQIVAQRRRAMAAWMLVGLLPRQVAIVVASQGVVVAMAAAVASTPLGVGAAYLALGALAGTVGAPAPHEGRRGALTGHGPQQHPDHQRGHPHRYAAPTPSGVEATAAAIATTTP